MKLKSSESLSIVLVVFTIGLFLASPAEAFPQTTKTTPGKVAVPTPANEAIYLPSPLSGLDAKLEPAEYYSTVIPADRFVTYEIDLRETLFDYSWKTNARQTTLFASLQISWA